MLSFDGGESLALEDLLARVERSATDDGIDGITLLGGEPFAHAESVSRLAKLVRERELSVMVFSGYTLEQLKRREEPAVQSLLHETDILVDGPYLREQPDLRRRWIGSRNQRVHFLTDRYNAGDTRWDEPDTLELRLENGELTVNGFPAPPAAALWKRS